MVKAGYLVAAGFACAGCKSNYVPPIQSATVRDSIMSHSFDSVGNLRLEEDSAVTTVNPHVRIIDGRKFLIADFSESQVRTYDSAGHLLNYFGRRGTGKNEFRVPVTSALRLRSGKLIATEFSGAVVELDSELTSVSSRTSSFLMPLYSAYVLSDSELVLAGPPSPTVPADPAPKLLHVFNLNSNSVARSFFAVPVKSEFASAAITLGVVSAAIHADTIAAVFALTDTVYLFTRAGTVVGRIPIPFRLFSHITRVGPDDNSIKARDEWLSEISMITDVYWLKSGSFVIQYFRGQAAHNEMSLLVMDRFGKARLEAQDTPALLAIDEREAAPRFFFASAGQEGVRKWIVKSLIAH